MAGADNRALALAAASGAAAAAVIAIGYVRHSQRQAAAPDLESLQCEPCVSDEAPATPVAISTAKPGVKKTMLAPTPRAALIGAAEGFVGFTKDQSSTVRRESYIPWHDYFMSVAVLSAFRSKDPNRQVGACIVDPRTLRIVGIGYNGFPWGCSDDSLPWARSADSGWCARPWVARRLFFSCSSHTATAARAAG